ncbi:528_t:CDS:2, partial [Racocetra persica]
VVNFLISDDEELLGISASSSKLTYLYIFSTTTGMNLSKYTYNDKKSVMIDGIHFIASNFGERVLITSHVHDSLERIKMDLNVHNVHRFHDEKLTFDYELMDPYTLMNPVNADKLFRRLKAKIKMPYIIKSDSIIYANDEQLFIEKLIKQSVKKWINYLRNDLIDYNKISTPLGKKDIINFIKNITSDLKKNIDRRDYYIQGTETYGRYLSWTLNCKDVTFTLEVSRKKSEISEENKQEPVHLENEREPVHEKNQQKANLYVRQCQALKNDDLVMVTEKCVILWTFIPSKGIRVHYIWGVDKVLDEEYWEYWEKLSKSSAERFLPPSDFDRIINEANIKPDKDSANLYNLLLENYIEENFFLAYYGKILMKKFLKSNKDLLVEKLCRSCIRICSYDKDNCDLQSNIQILSIIAQHSNIQSLSIIAQHYSELIQKNPAIIYKLLSQITFV